MANPIVVACFCQDRVPVRTILWISPGSFDGTFPTKDESWNRVVLFADGTAMGSIRRELIDPGRSGLDPARGLVIAAGVPYFTPSGTEENAQRLPLTVLLPSTAKSPTWTASFVPANVDDLEKTLFPEFFPIKRYGWSEQLGSNVKILKNIAFSDQVDELVTSSYGPH